MQICLLAPGTPKADWAHSYCPSMFSGFFPSTLWDLMTCEIHSRQVPHLLKLRSPNSKMPKFHTKVLSHFVTLGFLLHYVPAPCHQDSQYAEP